MKDARMLQGILELRHSQPTVTPGGPIIEGGWELGIRML